MEKRILTDKEIAYRVLESVARQSFDRHHRKLWEAGWTDLNSPMRQDALRQLVANDLVEIPKRN